jgi:hypothetical protein
MRRLAAAATLAAAALVASCGRGVEAGSFRFEAVPAEKSGLAFVHEIPGGVLDDIVKSAMGGVALIDYDGDGRVDVFLTYGARYDPAADGPPKPLGTPTCRLFRNLGGMKFEDVTEKAGVAFKGMALGACVGDFDGDGRPDIFVSACGRPALYRNKGDGTFEDVAEKAGLEPGLYAGATFLDYDRDGVLDLFASQYVDLADVDASLNHPGDFAPPSAYQPKPARLWHGRGDGTFEDVTYKAGVGTGGKGMGVLATDVDGDGWIDVVVANDTMPNFVWRNQGDGTFADAAARLGMAFGGDGEPRASMGVTAADLDGDGRLDYLIPDTRGGAVYVASGAYFTDRAVDWGFKAMTFGFIGWTDVAFDAENDGRLDVWKVHGDLRRAAKADGQWTKLVSNRGPTGPKGAMHFEYDPATEWGDGDPAQGAEVELTGRGAVAADFDDDGREDLLVVDLAGAARLFRNVTEKPGHWVRLRLVGKGQNTMALGARLTARAGDLKVVREVSGSTGYISAPDVRLHVGLGSATSLDDVVVRWPDGKEQCFGSLAADRDHVITEK